MADIGNLALIAAFTLSIYTVVAALTGALKRRNDLVVSAERSVIATFAMVFVSAFSLTVLLLKSDFHYQYVQSYSSRELPLFYKFAALWAGQAGSLLFWFLILSAITTAAVIKNRKFNRDLMPYVLMVFGIVTFFFAFVVFFLTNPFRELVTGMPGMPSIDFRPADGSGLNPLLQHPVMVIHPPILFVGYSGFIVTFAFAIAVLITRQLDASWIKITRGWTLFSWLFLGAGILLGAKWAYVELGWGGYWGWDPVENASLFPWLTGTAFLHSAMIQEKRGMFKIWNMVLIFLTFILCIFSSFLTRSGIISGSVHAFGESSIGTAFGYFLLFLIAGSFSLLFYRLSDLKSENKLDSLLSRESTFLFNNLILLIAMIATLMGTILPVISEIFTGSQATVGASYYLSVNVPIGLFLLFLTGVGPLFAWRKTSTYALRRNFLYPVVTALIAGVVMFVFGVRNILPLLSFFLCFFVAAAVIQEFWKGIRVRHRNLNEPYGRALVNALRGNTRKHGAYIVHLGVVLLFVGFTGGAYVLETSVELSEGESVTLGSYEIYLDTITNDSNPLFQFSEAGLIVKKGGKEVAYKKAQQRFYMASEQRTSELAIHSTLRDDLYLVFDGMNSDTNKAVFHIFVNPLVMWIWIGSIVLVIGSIIALLPSMPATRSVPKQRYPEKETIRKAAG